MINKTGYSVGDTITRKGKPYLVISVKQRPKQIITRRIVGNTIGKKRTFKI